MSWLSEEWKEQLPNDAITHIQTLEDTLTSFKNEVTQYQFKTEALESQIENLKQKCEEYLKDTKSLEREKVDVDAALEKEVEQNKSLIAILNKKDDLIRDNSEVASKLNEKLSIANTENNRLQHELLVLQKQTEEQALASKEYNSKSIEAKGTNQQRIEELKYQLDIETKDKNQQQNLYERKLSDSLAETKHAKGEIEVLRKEIKSLEYHLSSLQKNNDKLQEFNNKDVAREENVSKGVGEYLGIHFRKFQSESQLIVDPEKNQLLKENKCLVEKIEELEGHVNMLERRGTEGMSRNHVGENKISKMATEEQTDSGLFMREDSMNTRSRLVNNSLRYDPSTTKEVLISRLERTEELKDEMCVQTSRIDDQKENKAVVEIYKDENHKLKDEITQMKDVYEKHMRICKPQAKRSIEKINPQTEIVIEELNKKLSEQEEDRQVLVRQLRQQESKYTEMNEAFRSLQQNNCSVQKLDELVDIILQKKNSSESMTSSNGDNLRQLQVDFAGKISLLQDEIAKKHQVTREKIRNYIDKALSGVASTSNHGTPKIKSSSYNSLVFDEWGANMGAKSSSMLKAGGSIHELEVMKSRIDNIQQSVYSHENEMRLVQDERNHLQEELVKMMELMKKKDEELGRLSCNYQNEKRKVEESDSCFKMEMNALKHEQLEIYEEFREMCENLKKKDIELLNKSKQMKLLSLEWREKEDALNEKLLKTQQEIDVLASEKSKLAKENTECTNEKNLLLNRLNNSIEQISLIYENLSRIEDMFYKAKAKGLYN